MALIDVTQKVTSQLPNEPVKTDDKKGWKWDGLCPVTLESVTLRDQTDKDGEFQGITRKVLEFTFINYKGKNTNQPDRYTKLAEKAIGQKKDENGVLVFRTEKDVLDNNTDMFKRIAHILENCISSPTYRPISMINKKVQEQYFDLPGLVTEGSNEEQAIARAAVYDKFLTFICEWFNGDGKTTKPIHLNAEGKPFINGWLKVLPAYPKRNFYAIPTWVEQGFFEFATVDKTTGELNKAMIIKIRAKDYPLELAVGTAAISDGIPSGLPAGDGSPALQAFLNAQRGE